MRFSRRVVARTGTLVGVAAVGGGIALGGAALTGNLAGTSVIREIETLPVAATPAAFQRTGALTIADVYRRSAPGVVQVTTNATVTAPSDPFFGRSFKPQPTSQQALGSGFVIDKAGHIVTNYHVVQGATKVEVSFSNNDSVRATVVGSDPSTDIAVLHVDLGARALTPLRLGDSDSVNVGDSVVAIGNPFGLSRTITAGIVSALQRPIQAPNGFTIDHVIQTDAALNHGNSGGPLLDAAGEVVGVNSQIRSGANDVGFAVPINTVKTVAAQLVRNGRVERPYLGVLARPITTTLARLFRLPVHRGLLVERVEPGSPAANKLTAGTTHAVVAGESYTLGGDVITKVDGFPVASLARLRALISRHQPGDRLAIEAYRGTAKIATTIKLGRLPTTPSG